MWFSWSTHQRESMSEEGSSAISICPTADSSADAGAASSSIPEPAPKAAASEAEEPKKTWTCDICKITITIRGNGYAEQAHINGKNHQKRLRWCGLAPPLEKKRGRSDEPEPAAFGVDPSIRTADSSTNYKSVLNELCQQRRWRVEYEFASHGLDHEKEVC